MRLAPGSLPWVLVPLLAGLGILPFFPAYSLVPFTLAAGTALFFRDPERGTAPGVVAAADGRVRHVRDPNIVTFLNLHNVHVVRAPYAGEVTRIERFTGGHRPAFLRGAKRNAGVALTVETAWGPCEVRLVAGLVARRAVPYVQEGEHVQKGQRIGIIRFGSRVDVELPEGCEPHVRPGDRVRAAETSLAEEPEPLPVDEEAIP